MERSGNRVASAAIVTALVAGVLLVTAPSARASGPAAVASVDARDLLSGDRYIPAVIRITNEGTVPLSSIRLARPDAAIRILSASASGWQVSERADDHATFVGGVIAPSASAAFTLVVDIDRIAADRTGTWAVDVGAGPTVVAARPGPGNALASTLHVLRPVYITILPYGADDGTATTGQAVTLLASFVNEGTEPIDLTTATVAVTGVSAGPPTSAPVLAPGASGDVVVPAVVGPVGTTAIRVTVSDSSVPLLQAAGRTLTVQPVVQLKPRGADLLDRRSLECNPAPAQAGAELVCTILVDKHGAQWVVIDESSSFVIDDSVHPLYEAGLEVGNTFLQGDVERVRLSFEVATVPPGFNPGWYRPMVRFRGIDSNGAAVSIDRFTPSERVHVAF